MSDRARLFQIAVICHPEEKSKAPAELVVPIETILAKDEKVAALMAARKIPESYNEKLDRVEVAVRPF